MSERDLSKSAERVLSGLPSREDQQEETTGPTRPPEEALAEAVEMIENPRPGPSGPSREEIDEALRLADELDRGAKRS